MSGSSSKLEVRLLGPLEVRHEGEPLDLPRSKKTRALLAYLAATGREHTRNQLCTLLWDSTDDPRGALRWSLSKLRPLVNEDMERLSADRERVSFSAPDTLIDLREIERMVRRGVSSLSTDDLERGAALGRGEFLEAFELPDLFEFQSWCLAQREEARQQRCSILTELVDRLAGSPERALPWARELVQANPLDVAPRRVLFKLLFKLDRASEAEQQFEIATRLFRELDAPGIDQLYSSWSELQERSSSRARRSQENSESIHPGSEPTIISTPGSDRPGERPLVGRDAELATLQSAVDESRTDGKLTLTLLFGEPGVGKSRLADALADAAAASGVSILRGRSYEAERLYPFGPWVDALGTPISDLTDTSRTERAESREMLFQSIAERLAAKTREHSPVLLIFDDIQWIDPDSAELLHYVVRTTEAVPLGLLLIARTGEIEDNEASTSLLRGIRRVIAPSELELRPLSLEETTELIGETEGDPRAIWEASAGNPLYALELARALDQGGASGSLARVVRERIARLPAAAGDLLRWGSVLGHTFAVSRLETLSSLGTKELIEALEGLEVHALVRSDSASSGTRYTFSHDLVREFVYGEMSQPRRRLMHRRVARLLAPELPDPVVAIELVRHASLGGEASLGVKACIEAGHDALRTFANADAHALSRRGLDLVDELSEEDRISASLDLLHIQFSARTPDRESAAERVQGVPRFPQPLQRHPAPVNALRIDCTIYGHEAVESCGKTEKL